MSQACSLACDKRDESARVLSTVVQGLLIAARAGITGGSIIPCHQNHAADSSPVHEGDKRFGWHISVEMPMAVDDRELLRLGMRCNRFNTTRRQQRH